MIIYRKQSLNITQYINSIKQTLNDNDINIIFGDFNINYLSDDEIKPLKSLMTSLDYKQVVQSPTFVSAGSLLDHVYVKGNFQTIQCSVLAVYYSDHDGVKISIFWIRTILNQNNINYSIWIYSYTCI